MAASSPSVRADASSSVAPVQTPPIVETAPEPKVLRTAAVSICLPNSVYNGRLANPDPVLRQFGGAYQIAFYRLMPQQNLALSADMSQYEDRVNAIDSVIRPGDPDSEESIRLAQDVTRVFRRVPGTNIINLWILRARWYGLCSIGMAGWVKDAETGLVAPMDVYNIEPWRWKFGPNFEAYLLTAKRPLDGELVADGSVGFARWGSLFTAYGESDLRDVYLSAWYMQNVQEMLLQSIEILGRPVPWIEVGDQLQGTEFDNFEAGIARQYRYYVITRTPGGKTSSKLINENILANGGAGRSELEFIRHHEGLISRKILGTQQTQDKTGGSRALESTRMEIAQDKTPPGRQFIDEWWTRHWIAAIGMRNFPKVDRRLWPVMDSGAAERGEEALNGAQMLALDSLSERLRLNLVTREWAVEMLVKSKFKRERAEKMVQSILDSKTISRAPVDAKGATVGEQVSAASAMESVAKASSEFVASMKETQARLAEAALAAARRSDRGDSSGEQAALESVVTNLLSRKSMETYA